MRIYRIHAARLPAIVVIAATLALGSVAAGQTPSASPGRSFLWKVQAGASVLYLAGSVHALGPDAYPLGAAMENAFHASGTLVEEVDLGQADLSAAVPMLLAQGMYRDGRSFESVVSKETATLVAGRLKDTGVPLDMMRAMKPWMVMLVLTALEAQKAGLDPSLGLDKYFFDKAKAAGKPVVGLETVQSQVDRFDRMPETLQEQLLQSTVRELDTARDTLDAMVSAWKRGDAAAVEKMSRRSLDEYPAAYTSLIVERNRNWIPQIEACFTKPMPCFVVVGAAHLVGPDGLLALLAQKGYRLEQQ